MRMAVHMQGCADSGFGEPFGCGDRAGVFNRRFDLREFLERLA